MFVKSEGIEPALSELMWFEFTWFEFLPISFNCKIIPAPSIFENAAASRVFIYCYIMTRCHAPVGEIQRPPELEVEYPLPSNLWVLTSDGSWRVNPNATITTPPKSSSFHFSINLQTSKGDVPIAVSPYVNSIISFIGVKYGWVNLRVIQTHSRTPKGLRSSYRK